MPHPYSLLAGRGPDFKKNRANLSLPNRITKNLARPLLAGLLLLAALALPALADVAPPEQAPGSSIGPDGPTQVRMLAETVVLDIRASQAGPQPDRLAGSRAEAEVSATFQMRNLGQADEEMLVRFPLQAPTGFFDLARVEGFSASVAGQPVATRTTTGLLEHAYGQDVIDWATFPVRFPAGQDVTIDVAYKTRPTGYVPAARFSYVLQTGAGWRDTIGSVDIIARLPYTATEENVLLGPNRTNDGASYQTTPGGQFAGNEVRWHLEELEPTRSDNIYVNVLLPGAWQRIVAARAAVAANPDDVDALLALSEAYAGAVTNDFPAESNDPYAALAEQTLARAVALQPGSAELFTRLARMLWDHQAIFYATADDPALQPILAELNRALAIDPHYGPALDLAQDIRSVVTNPEALPLPALSAAPQSLPQSGGPAGLPPGLLMTLAGLGAAGLGLAARRREWRNRT